MTEDALVATALSTSTSVSTISAILPAQRQQVSAVASQCNESSRSSVDGVEVYNNGTSNVNSKRGFGCTFLESLETEDENYHQQQVQILQQYGNSNINEIFCNSNNKNGLRLLELENIPNAMGNLTLNDNNQNNRVSTTTTSTTAPAMQNSTYGLTSNQIPTVTAFPGTWFYETGPTDENSSVSGGVFSGGSGFSSSGSGPASTGAPGDCSPLPNGAVDYGNSNNFDDELDLHLLRTTDIMLPGSRNVTESVEVPSSEHVAEIVGRQGCKIKALRAKTNTYIKTPVRGEEPVFVVTGRREDVLDAKREIECAAEHFTQIRASRRHSQGGAPAPGHVTAYVRVPLRVVGLVVGPKGATIKRIQQDTHTYIITPSREREPIFEVTGLPQNVDAARREIEQHIYQRTGNMPITDPSQSIANFDLNAAAAQVAAQAAVTNGSRPNYGALAAVNRLQQQESGLTTASFAEYQKQQQNWQVLDYRNEFAANTAMSAACNASDSTFNSASLNILQQQKAFVNPSVPSQLQSANENNYFFNNLEASTMTNPQLPVCNNVGNAQTLRSESGNQYLPSALDRSYQPWSNGSSSLGIGSDFSNFAQDFFSSNANKPTANGVKSNRMDLFESIGVGAGGVTCGLSSVNSTSRDEGLGDSPTNSFGKMNNDPYQLMISSIWSNIESANHTPREKIDAAATLQQLATA